MDNNNFVDDNMGIRVSGSNLPYTTGNSSAWVGSGIINKPIGDFFTGTFNNWVVGISENDPHFAARADGSVQVVVNSQIIPEPEEYVPVVWLVCAQLCSLPPPSAKETPPTSHHHNFVAGGHSAWHGGFWSPTSNPNAKLSIHSRW